MAFVSTALFIVQFVLMSKITQKFKETKGNAYMKFEYVAQWCEIYNNAVGLLVFFTILKLMKILRFNKKMSLLSDTLRNCWKKLLGFSITFMIVFSSFVLFFNLILLSDMFQFATILRSWKTCFGMILGRFEFREMTRSNLLSPIFFILFMVVNMFILLNMTLSIIIESFSAVKNDLAKQVNDYEIIDYICNRFKTWTGMHAYACVYVYI